MSTSSTTRQFAAAARMFLALTLLLGVLYPAVIWGIGRIGLSDQADGSRIERGGVVVGSSLLGQNFTDERHFQSRPSASEYAGGVSGSNLYASNEDQQGRSPSARARMPRRTGRRRARRRPDRVGGLDPHISPANALAQARAWPRERLGGCRRGPRASARRAGSSVSSAAQGQRPRAQPRRRGAGRPVSGRPASTDRASEGRESQPWPGESSASTSARRRVSGRPSTCSPRPGAARSVAPTS